MWLGLQVRLKKSVVLLLRYVSNHQNHEFALAHKTDGYRQLHNRRNDGRDGRTNVSVDPGRRGAALSACATPYRATLWTLVVGDTVVQRVRKESMSAWAMQPSFWDHTRRGLIATSFSFIQFHHFLFFLLNFWLLLLLFAKDHLEIMKNFSGWRTKLTWKSKQWQTKVQTIAK